MLVAARVDVSPLARMCVSKGYVLLGASNAKRNNCSGKLTIARWPKSPRAASLMLAPPAKEERSDVLTLACEVLEATEETMKSKSVSISQLRDAVLEWSPFIADSIDICAERTRRREAVFFTSRHILEWYAHSFRGQVEISSDFWQDFGPMCYVLPRASPYEDAVRNA
ncbi:hypothetical protein HPB49_011900 [Dermacentor silvarum]|uniref:Uncharacterized protein n=1 Tax=Dermacentor silvarum TaxID=543639 RepID=A0ACB8DD08_DERSI|nr:hypothetical protein HPB49_011900 [Dermacentor silvarum]